MRNNLEVSIQPVKQSSWLPSFDRLCKSVDSPQDLLEGEPFEFVVRSKDKHSEALRIAHEIYMAGMRLDKYVIDTMEEGDTIKITFTPCENRAERLHRQLASFWASK